MKPALYLGKRGDVFRKDTPVEVHGEGMVGRPAVFRYLVKKTRMVDSMPYANMGIYTDSFHSYTKHNHQWYKRFPREFIWVSPEDVLFMDNNNLMAKRVLIKFEE